MMAINSEIEKIKNKLLDPERAPREQLDGELLCINEKTKTLSEEKSRYIPDKSQCRYIRPEGDEDEDVFIN